MTESELEYSSYQVSEKLLNRRAQRIRYLLDDDKILVGWNAPWITAYALEAFCGPSLHKHREKPFQGDMQFLGKAKFMEYPIWYLSTHSNQDLLLDDYTLPGSGVHTSQEIAN
jgi:hypothetical protein